MDIKQAYLKYYWAINLLALALLAYVLAGTVNTVLAKQLAPAAPKVPEYRVAVQTNAPEYSPDSGRIHSRDLFGSVPKEPPPVADPIEPMDGDTAIEATTLRLELIMITYYDESDLRNRAIIKNLKDQSSDLYGIGATIGEDSKIHEIETDRVLIARRDGKIEELRLAKTERSLVPDRVAMRPPGRGKDMRGRGRGSDKRDYDRDALIDKITQLSETEYIIERDAVEEVLDNLDKFVSEAGLRPVFEGSGADRALQGFKLRVRRDSIVEHLGLQQGDMLMSVNGQQLDVQAAMGLLESLRNQSNFSLEIERRGEPINMQYRVQ